MREFVVLGSGKTGGVQPTSALLEVVQGSGVRRRRVAHDHIQRIVVRRRGVLDLVQCRLTAAERLFRDTRVDFAR